MTVEAGKWYRTPEGQPCRTTHVGLASGRWHVEGIDGHRWAWPADQLTPWVPKVGEWVRLETVDEVDPGGNRGKVGRVSLVEHGNAFLEGGGAGLLTPRPEHYHVEPCLPPDEKIEPLRAEAGPGVITPYYAERISITARARGANGTCPKCGGPAYVGLQKAECLAEKCERVEPEPMVCQAWVGFCHPPNSDGAVRSEVPPWEDGAEPFWTAYGLGLLVNHPIRKEAIRLWREAVRKAGAR